MTELHKLNLEIAHHLRVIAQLYTIEDSKKHRFRIKIFEEAADTVATLQHDITKVDIATYDGIGKSVIEVIDNYLGTGTSQRFCELSKKWPVECLTMTVVTGIGPKIAYDFHQQGIHNFTQLVTAAQTNQITERFIPNVLAAATKQNSRVPHHTAQAIATWITNRICQISPSVMVCGSIRRQTIDSKDIDIIACPEPEHKYELINKFRACGELINQGRRKTTLRVTSHGVQLNVDLWIIEKWYTGAALIYATGSKEHCIALRSRAKAHGYTLNEYGIFLDNCVVYNEQHQLAGKTEEEVYKFLGLPWLVPTNRTGHI